MGSFNVALLEALLSAGVSNERARKVVDLFDQAVDERYGLHSQVLATKRDVAELETGLAREIAQARTQIAETKADLLKWTLAALTAQTALLLGALRIF
jgi:hypothetical protein